MPQITDGCASKNAVTRDSDLTYCKKMRSRRKIYLDYQASTPLDPAVLREMLPFLTESFANPHSADHAAGWEAARAVEESANKLSTMIGCDPDEIIFTSGATEANNLAIIGLRKVLKSKKRKKIITSRIEHKSILSACRALAEEFDAEILYCDVRVDGCIDLGHLQELLSDQVLLVTFGGVNSEIGSIQSVPEIYKLADRHGVLVHVDGAQMPAAVSLDAVSHTVAMMSLSSHKMYGPKGIGCLYVERSLQRDLAPIVFGGGQQNGLRSGTLPVPLCVGMGSAAQLSRKPEERHSLRNKSRKLWDALRAIDDRLVLNGPAGSDRHPGNLNIRFPGILAEDLLASLQPTLAASIGSACTSGIPEPSHVLRGIGLTEDEARSSIRFSVGRFTTESEIEEAAELVASAFSQLDRLGMREAL
ncbi:cysteine desulfurase [Brucella pseudogrignonensis]|uniref:cysteine desulfurase family protein n=1 Tax=Brucella pseudogrignonensis TaxID=419475 RepID=UPI001EDC2434|nr:cysteine desulfurase family protein [Brucella pseudogrignonensis]UKK94111.1 cysteine desulfurase [Brucella pseudogrignonensis]